MERTPSPSPSGSGAGGSEVGGSAGALGAPGSLVALRRSSTGAPRAVPSVTRSLASSTGAPRAVPSVTRSLASSTGAPRAVPSVTRSLASASKCSTGTVSHGSHSRHSASLSSGSRRESSTSAITSGSSAGTSSLSRSSYSSRRSSKEASTESSTMSYTNSTSSSAGYARWSGDSGSGDSTVVNRPDSGSDASRRSISTIEEEGEDGEGHEDGWAGQGAEGGEVTSGEEQTPPPSSPSCSGSEADWTEDKWLEMADHYDAQRRVTTTVEWEGRKQKYPELFRSDVSICPSYSQFQVPYWSVCHRRYARSLRRIHRRLAEDIEEMALLQTRALDGVRVVRCFSLGVRPHPPPPDPLTAKQRLRVEHILAQ